MSAQRYVCRVFLYGRDNAGDHPDDTEDVHVTAYTAADALTQVELHNKHATGVDFVAVIRSIEPYELELHGEWKLGRLLPVDV